MKSPPQHAIFGDRASDEADKSGGNQGLRTASVIETAGPKRSQIDDIHRRIWIALRRGAPTLLGSSLLSATGHNLHMARRGPRCHRIMFRAC